MLLSRGVPVNTMRLRILAVTLKVSLVIAAAGLRIKCASSSIATAKRPAMSINFCTCS